MASPGLKKFFFSGGGAGGGFRSIDFDGIAEYMRSAGALIGIVDTWTLAVWVRMNKLAKYKGANQVLLDIKEAGVTDNRLRIQQTHDSGGSGNDEWWITRYNETSGISNHQAMAGPVEENEWVHVAATFTNGGSLLSYINGELWNTTTPAGAAVDDTNRTVTIGADGNGALFSEALIFQVAAWDVVLGAAAIKEIYNLGNGKGYDISVDGTSYTSSADLQHYWTLGNNANDFGEDLGAATAIDVDAASSGIAVGDLSGIVPTGRATWSVRMNGTDEYLANSSTVTWGLVDDYTINLWISLKELAATKGSTLNLLDLYNGAGNNNRIKISQVDATGDKFRLHHFEGNGTETQIDIADVTPALDTWVMLTMTWDSANFRAYANGVEDSASNPTVTTPVARVDASRILTLGSLDSGDSLFSGALFGKLSMWDEALGAAEITELYAFGGGDRVDETSNFGDYTSSAGLIHQYTFNNRSDIGEDLGTATAVDIDAGGSGITAADNLVPEGPIDAVHDYRSTDMSGVSEYYRTAGTSGQALDIANAWTAAVWVNLDTLAVAKAENEMLLQIKRNADNVNQILIQQLNSSGTNRWRAIVYNTSGSSTGAVALFGTVATTGWHQIVVTWDGTDIEVYLDGVSDLATVTPGGGHTQADSGDRILSVGANINGGDEVDGRLYSGALWASALTSTEVGVIYNSGNATTFDLTADSGSYTSSADLVHYWELGNNRISLGEDLGDGATAIDITAGAVGIDVYNLSDDVPS